MAALASATSPIEKESAQIDLLNALSALRVTGRFSDLTITCNYRQWSVHKAIICSRSGFFDTACSSSFLEAQNGVIDISEDDEDAVEEMIHFFYHLDYATQSEAAIATDFKHKTRSLPRLATTKPIDLMQIEDPLLSQAGNYSIPEQGPSCPSSPVESRCSLELFPGKHQPPASRPETPTLSLDGESDTYSMHSDIDSDPQLLLHTRVYALAEKYDIPSLKPLAKKKFEIAMACYYDSPEFAQAIEEVYCSTIDSDRGLRDVVLEAFKSHPQLASTQDVFDVIKDTPSLALELFKVERGIPV